MQKREINARLAPQPASAYSQAVEVTGGIRILYVSGQLGMDTDGTTPSTMAEQARLAWRNVAAQSSEAGMGFDNLVKVTMIIPDAAEIPASRPARAEALGDLRPASTLIVAGLANPAWKIEIEAIACA
jgi:2-iminobutanoate/2-iminopropanoate deaminase